MGEAEPLFVFLDQVGRTAPQLFRLGVVPLCHVTTPSRAIAFLGTLNVVLGRSMNVKHNNNLLSRMNTF